MYFSATTIFFPISVEWEGVDRAAFELEHRNVGGESGQRLGNVDNDEASGQYKEETNIQTKELQRNWYLPKKKKGFCSFLKK